ncbi:MAG: hypothetical protein AAB573_05265 [Patescibacteria group bacterium]
MQKLNDLDRRAIKERGSRAARAEAKLLRRRKNRLVKKLLVEARTGNDEVRDMALRKLNSALDNVQFFINDGPGAKAPAWMRRSQAAE